MVSFSYFCAGSVFTSTPLLSARASLLQLPRTCSTRSLCVVPLPKQPYLPAAKTWVAVPSQPGE